MELLVVVSILGLLSSIAVVYVVDAHKKAQIEATRTQIDAIRMAVTRFQLEVNRLPENLEELVIEGDENWPGPFLDAEEEPSDAWGNKFRFVGTRKRIRIASAGPDGHWDTTDDLWK